MNRRAPIVLDIYLVFVGAFIGLATNYVSNESTGFLRVIRQWSLPLLGLFIVLLVVGRLWQRRIEKVQPRVPWDRTRSPYPGLEPFTENEAGTFFGRDRDIAALMRRLDPAVPGEAVRLVPVIGPSGSGKSSTIQAGLVPRLTSRRERWMVLPVMVPGAHPVRNLARSLSSMVGNDSVDEVAAALAAESEALDRALENVRARVRARSPRVLLVVDQAEELFTQASQDDRATMMRSLAGALARNPWLWVVVVLRTEFMNDFLQEEQAALFQQPVSIGVLDRVALFDVIERPAAAAGLRFEPPTLVNRMVDEAGGGEALPLLAYTLHELWQRAGGNGVVTVREYEDLGGVAGALSKRANEVRDQLEGHDDDELVLRTLVRFVAIDSQAGGAETFALTRRRVPREALDEREWRVADAFISARLLATDTDPKTGATTIQVTHEALIERWSPLRQAVETRVAELQLRTRLERWAQEWLQADRSDEYLLSGERLQAALQWVEAADDSLTGLPVVYEYLERSAKADEATMRRLGEASAGRALEYLDRDPELALIGGLAAIREFGPTSLSYQVLVATLAASHLRVILRAHDGPVLDVAWSPVGGRLATAGADGSVRCWDAAGVEVGRLEGHEGAVSAVAWSPDGARLVTAGADGSVRCWDAAGVEVGRLEGHEGAVSAVAWSPDSALLATVGVDGSGRIWDVVQGTLVGELWGHQGKVSGVAWSPDCARVATAGADATVRIWDPVGTEIGRLEGHEGAVSAVAWSPEGERLATASADWSVRVWCATRLAELTMLFEHDAPALDVAWSPDGTRLVSGGGDRALILWDVEHSLPLVSFRGHSAAVTAVSWSADGMSVASSSADGTGRIWRSSLAVLRHARLTRAVAWSPDGDRLASCAADNTVRIWDALQGTELAVLSGHESDVVHIAWSPDGDTLATASRDHTIRLWDCAEATLSAVMKGHTGLGTWIAWSPDGKRLASASLDRTVRVWDTEAATPTHVLQFAAEATWVGWSPSGDRIAVALADNTVRIQPPEPGQPALVITGHDGDVWGASWSPDGSAIATASFDRSIRVWDTATTQLVRVMEGHEDAVFAVAWSPEPGAWLASVGRDRTVRLWDARTGGEVAVLRGHSHPVWGLAWSRDGARLATSSDDGMIRLWELPPDLDGAVRIAERLALREPTGEERRRLLLPASRAVQP